MDRARGAPLALRVLFVLAVVYTGRIGPLVADAMLLALLWQACRSDSAVPRNAAAAVTGLVIGITALQVTSDVAGGARDFGRIVTNVGAIYFAGYAFGLFALLRRWEKTESRARVMARMREAFWRVAPAVVVILGLLATRVLVDPSFGGFLPAPVRPIVVVKSAVVAPAFAFILPVLSSAPDGTLAARWRRPLVCVWVIAVAVYAFEGRAAALGVGVALAVTYLRPARLARAGYVLAIMLAVMWGTGLSFDLGHREISFDAAVEAAGSLIELEPASESNYAATREWRTDWWSQIVEDIREEPLLFSGLGWDTSLGDHYGINDRQISVGDDTSRVHFPHNLFMTLAGLGGVVLAVAFLSVPVLSMARRPQGLAPEDVPIVKATKAALVAALVVSGTGVLVEGSQGGWLYWSVMGFLWWLSTAPAEVVEETRAGRRGRLSPASPSRARTRSAG